MNLRGSWEAGLESSCRDIYSRSNRGERKYKGRKGRKAEELAAENEFKELGTAFEFE